MNEGFEFEDRVVSILRETFGEEVRRGVQHSDTLNNGEADIEGVPRVKIECKFGKSCQPVYVLGRVEVTTPPLDRQLPVAITQSRRDQPVLVTMYLEDWITLLEDAASWRS